MSFESLKRKRDAALTVGPPLIREEVYNAAKRSIDLEAELGVAYAVLAAAFGESIEAEETPERPPQGLDLDVLIEKTRPLRGSMQILVLDALPLTGPPLELDALTRILYDGPLSQERKDAARRLVDKLVKRGYATRLKVGGGRSTAYMRTAKVARVAPAKKR